MSYQCPPPIGQSARRGVIALTALLAGGAVMIAFSGCHQRSRPQHTGPPVVLLDRYQPGFDFNRFVQLEHLQGAPVREAAASTADRRQLAVFAAGGTLHLSLRRGPDGAEVLYAVPFLVPSDEPAEQRLVQWDQGVHREEALGQHRKK